MTTWKEYDAARTKWHQARNAVPVEDLRKAYQGLPDASKAAKDAIAAYTSMRSQRIALTVADAARDRAKIDSEDSDG